MGWSTVLGTPSFIQRYEIFFLTLPGLRGGGVVASIRVYFLPFFSRINFFPGPNGLDKRKIHFMRYKWLQRAELTCRIKLWNFIGFPRLKFLKFYQFVYALSIFLKKKRNLNRFHWKKPESNCFFIIKFLWKLWYWLVYCSIALLILYSRCYDRQKIMPFLTSFSRFYRYAHGYCPCQIFLDFFWVLTRWW